MFGNIPLQWCGCQVFLSLITNSPVRSISLKLSSAHPSQPVSDIITHGLNISHTFANYSRQRDKNRQGFGSAALAHNGSF